MKRKSGEKRKLNYQVQFYHKSGKVIWVDVYSALSQFNGREAIQLAFLEITERKLSEMVLQESEEKYRSLFESEIDAIGLFDSETMKIIDCNMSLLKLYGYSREEVYNITGFDLSAESEKSKTSILKTISQKQDKVNLKYHKKKDGTIFPVEINSVLFTWKGKKIICGIFRDISERVESENKLKEFNEKLQESNKSKDRFFSIVAHDLRSPFHGLLGLSQLLCENYEEFEGKEIKDNLQLMRNAIKNVYNLLDNLLQWSRIQLGKIDFNPAVFDFYDSLNNVINIFQSKLNEKNIKVLNLIRAGTFVHADEKMTQSIIQNLLTNAIKFSHPNSTIKIESAVIDSMVSISIADEGVGIPAEAIPELFNIGSQYSTRGTNNEEGTGLGLILCRQLVEKNGGKIRAVSKKEIGSIFSFTLPSAGI
jgi:PAS domain S-box-containing protein